MFPRCSLLLLVAFALSSVAAKPEPQLGSPLAINDMALVKGPLVNLRDLAENDMALIKGPLINARGEIMSQQEALKMAQDAPTVDAGAQGNPINGEGMQVHLGMPTLKQSSERVQQMAVDAAKHVRIKGYAGGVKKGAEKMAENVEPVGEDAQGLGMAAVPLQRRSEVCNADNTGVVRPRDGQQVAVGENVEIFYCGGQDEYSRSSDIDIYVDRQILKAHQYPDNRDADTRDGWSSYHFYVRWPTREGQVTMEIVENARDYNGRTISGVARTDVRLDVVRGGSDYDDNGEYDGDDGEGGHSQRSLAAPKQPKAPSAPEAPAAPDVPFSTPDAPATHGLPGDAQLHEAQAEAEGLGRGIKMMRRGKKTQPYAADV